MIARMYKKILSSFLRNSLKKRLILIILFMGLFPLFISIFMLYKPISYTIVDDYAKSMESGMNDTTLLIEQALSDYKGLSQSIYSNSSYLNVLRHGTSYKNNAEYNNIRATLSLLIVNDPTISELRFYMPKQSEMLSINRRNWTVQGSIFSESEELLDYDAKEPLFKLIPLQNIETFDSRQPIFSTVQYIQNFPWSDLLAVMAMEVDGTRLDDLLKSRIMFDHENLCLLSQDQELLYRRGTTALSSDFFSRLINSLDFQQSGVVRIMLDGEPYLTCLQKLSKYNLYALRFVPQKDLTQRATGILQRTMILYLLLLLLVLLWGLSLSRRALKPIGTLSAYMQRVENGHFGESMDEKNMYDEFRLLVHRFNLMSDEIERLIRETYQLKLSQRTTELKALQSQINPHFIFNTLQNIHYLALQHNAYEINLIVDALSDILHYSLRGDSDIVPLREEISIVKKYLGIQQVRFIDRLVVHIDAQSETLDLPLPKMTLQPLLENSVIHGMRDSDKICRVSLSAARDRNAYLLDIQDDGAGMSQERLNEIRDSLESDGIDLLDGTNIGLRNCWLRLKNLYPQGLTFEITSAPGQGTRIHITIIPQEKD